jgi:hypothetical protein
MITFTCPPAPRGSKQLSVSPVRVIDGVERAGENPGYEANVSAQLFSQAAAVGRVAAPGPGSSNFHLTP